MIPIATVMLVAAGLFAGGAATVAWSRVPIWRRMSATTFLPDFAQTIAWTDKVQPALLVIAIVSSAAFAATAGGSAALIVLPGTVALVGTLVGSVAILVPLQRTIIATPTTETLAIDAMRERWFTGNLGRAIVAVLAFTAIALAAVA